jgi:hypothetical protein
VEEFQQKFELIKSKLSEMGMRSWKNRHWQYYIHINLSNNYTNQCRYREAQAVLKDMVRNERHLLRHPQDRKQKNVGRSV